MNEVQATPFPSRGRRLLSICESRVTGVRPDAGVLGVVRRWFDAIERDLDVMVCKDERRGAFKPVLVAANHGDFKRMLDQECGRLYGARDLGFFPVCRERALAGCGRSSIWAITAMLDVPGVTPSLEMTGRSLFKPV